MSSLDSVLQLLIENESSYISGEDMAKKLGLSRNAVWKAISQLRSKGYEINAVSNKGYCLTSQGDILSIQGILNHVDKNICTPEIKIFESLDSTNTRAKELAIDGAKHGTLILANSQQKGRGHYESTFGSPDGGLYLSLILDPEKSAVSSPAHISAWVAVSVCRVIEELEGIAPSIRLITDIYSENAKIAGILTESAFDFETGRLQWIVVGIGIPELAKGKRNAYVGSLMNQLLVSKTDTESIIDYYNNHHE